MAKTSGATFDQTLRERSKRTKFQKSSIKQSVSFTALDEVEIETEPELENQPQ